MKFKPAPKIVWYQLDKEPPENVDLLTHAPDSYKQVSESCYTKAEGFDRTANVTRWAYLNKPEAE